MISFSIGDLKVSWGEEEVVMDDDMPTELNDDDQIHLLTIERLLNRFDANSLQVTQINVKWKDYADFWDDYKARMKRGKDGITEFKHYPDPYNESAWTEYAIPFSLIVKCTLDNAVLNTPITVELTPDNPIPVS